MKEQLNTTVPLIPGFADSAAKRGNSFNAKTTIGSWNTNIVNLKSNWFYSWGTLPPADSIPDKIEFIPMFWSGATVTSSNLTGIKALKASGNIHYILGFNEPDKSDQSNMTVKEALALWPRLESIGLPLGSPAASWPTQKWIYDFLDSAIIEHRRVDFICVHMYVGLDDSSFVAVLQHLYTRYHLPIWITEFATADNTATTKADNRYSPAEVLSFMQRLLPKLEALPYVKRYAWFSGSPDYATLWSSSLVNTDGSLTALGIWYSAYKP